MKKASIISIGNELLGGWTIDTNSAYLAKELLSIGIPVVSIYTVGDETDAIVLKLKLACSEADIVIVTGGLGPTDDDLTRQAFAELLGVELQLQDELIEQIGAFFAARNLPMPEKNKIQAHIPAGAKALENKIGTAPGILAESEGKILVAMPGVPAEMKLMFESIIGQLQQFTAAQAVVTRKLRCCGVGESTIAEMLGDLMQRGRNPQINCTAGSGVITLYIIATAGNTADAEKLARKDEEVLRSKLGKLIFGDNEQTLAEVVGQRLAQQKKTIATVESCTGGLLAKMLTDIPGSSRYFIQGWITYTNNAKTAELGVPSELLEKYGAVSEQVASAMAACAREIAKTDFAVGITGIAGPTGQTADKPTGLVYICIASEKGVQTQQYIFPGNRESVRFRTAQTTLNLLRQQLL